MNRQTGGGAGAAKAPVSDLTALGAVIGHAGGCAGSTRWAARGIAASPTSAQQIVAPRAPVRASARPSVGEGMIPERAGCGKSARPVRRAATGNGVGLNRVMPAHHRASRRLYPGRLFDRHKCLVFRARFPVSNVVARVQTALAAPSRVSWPCARTCSLNHRTPLCSRSRARAQGQDPPRSSRPLVRYAG